ncbi:ectonucleoside triphosphate diphosphohydrolase 6 [Takifugu flavidus]|uniref:nucleoside diphosphate phosphatase n=1 Tax=Takifugu flavidus TaxID=433684 RepID=A0A5C6PIK1_9TELE|nr:ectonucleoside triphosphate diphosphohydrolase 6 [Takifugu flavidus]XP_056903443.1 ectonucleoside triphosphate diphosphohydrolase 6 [Takifugu flavidus]XP_056903444.1 ectonucleoside triphosphate diphosphohydrolase 6 [Takifugu flavidus]TWW78528.1 Ectonucleoside triphosphate diphosphohydrolase 6 [Takifugu flavidus]
MKVPKLAGVFIFVGFLLTYLTFVKRQRDAAKLDGQRPPQHGVLGWTPPRHQRPTFAAATNQYCIMFDAGSTGTRIHVFQFRMEDRGVPSLHQETFRSIQPGLSAYADHPRECSAGISELLKVAQSTVPASLWSSTPVLLRATAGLRLLPEQKAQDLLDTVKLLLMKSPFLSGGDSVSILDGVDEGIFAWITLNFITGGLHHADSAVGMLDLGGGSFQITFSPQDEKTIQMSPIDYIRSFRMFNNTHTVYTHSYLGLGLMSARLAILGGVDASPLGGSTELVSPCLAPEYSGSWEYAEVVYTVRGQKAGEPLYEACVTRVEKFLYKKLLKVSEAADADFFSLSYFYDRVVDLALLGEGDEGTVHVSDYVNAAKRVCSGLSVSPQQSPFLCLDLVYISVLLQELGFSTDKQFKLAKTMNHVGLSWSLGAAFHHLNTLNTH